MKMSYDDYNFAKNYCYTHGITSSDQLYKINSFYNSANQHGIHTMEDLEFVLDDYFRLKYYHAAIAILTIIVILLVIYIITIKKRMPNKKFAIPDVVKVITGSIACAFLTQLLYAATIYLMNYLSDSFFVLWIFGFGPLNYIVSLFVPIALVYLILYKHCKNIYIEKFIFFISGILLITYNSLGIINEFVNGFEYMFAYVLLFAVGCAYVYLGRDYHEFKK